MRITASCVTSVSRRVDISPYKMRHDVDVETERNPEIEASVDC